jgi:hypothetical protein
VLVGGLPYWTNTYDGDEWTTEVELLAQSVETTHAVGEILASVYSKEKRKVKPLRIPRPRDLKKKPKTAAEKLRSFAKSMRR